MTIKWDTPQECWSRRTCLDSPTTPCRSSWIVHTLPPFRTVQACCKTSLNEPGGKSKRQNRSPDLHLMWKNYLPEEMGKMQAMSPSFPLTVYGLFNTCNVIPSLDWWRLQSSIWRYNALLYKTLRLLQLCNQMALYQVANFFSWQMEIFPLLLAKPFGGSTKSTSRDHVMQNAHCLKKWLPYHQNSNYIRVFCEWRFTSRTVPMVNGNNQINARQKKANLQN